MSESAAARLFWSIASAEDQSAGVKLSSVASPTGVSRAGQYTALKRLADAGLVQSGPAPSTKAQSRNAHKLHRLATALPKLIGIQVTKLETTVVLCDATATTFEQSSFLFSERIRMPGLEDPQGLAREVARIGNRQCRKHDVIPEAVGVATFGGQLEVSKSWNLRVFLDALAERYPSTAVTHRQSTHAAAFFLSARFGLKDTQLQGDTFIVIELEDDGIGVSPVVAGMALPTEVGDATASLLAKTVKSDPGPLQNRLAKNASGYDPFHYTTASFFAPEQKLLGLAKPLRAAGIYGAWIGGDTSARKIIENGLSVLSDRLDEMRDTLVRLYGTLNVVLVSTWPIELLELVRRPLSRSRPSTITLVAAERSGRATTAALGAFDIDAYLAKTTPDARKTTGKRKSSRA